jgi:hypothetical protein
MIWTAGTIALLSLVSVTAPTHAPPPRPAQIILIRHGDKPADPDDPHLSPAGVARARQLVAFIAGDAAMNKFGPPVAIFATQTTKHDNGQRTQETVAPLAAALKLQVQTPYLGKDYAALAKRILSNPAYAGKTILICWNHEVIPELVAALGVTPEPPKWKGHIFDRVYIISYANGKAVLTESRYGAK